MTGLWLMLVYHCSILWYTSYSRQVGIRCSGLGIEKECMYINRGVYTVMARRGWRYGMASAFFLQPT